MRRSGERSCWSSGCVRTAQLPGTTADGQNWQHSQHHLQSDVTVISVLFPVITSAASMICPINQKYFICFFQLNTRSPIPGAPALQQQCSKVMSVRPFLSLTPQPLFRIYGTQKFSLEQIQQGHPAKDFMLTETLFAKIIFQSTEPGTPGRGVCGYVL